MYKLSVRLQPEGFYAIESTTNRGRISTIAVADTESEAKKTIAWLKKSGQIYNIQKVAND